MSIELALIGLLALAVLALVIVRPEIVVFGVGIFLFAQGALVRLETVPVDVRQAIGSADAFVLVMLFVRTAVWDLKDRGWSIRAVSTSIHPALWALAAFVLVGLVSAVINSVALVPALVGLYMGVKFGMWFYVASSLRLTERAVVLYGYLLGGLFLGVVSIAVIQVAGVETPWDIGQRAAGPAATSIWNQHTVFGSTLVVAAGLAVAALRLRGERISGLVLAAVAAIGIFVSSVRRLLVTIPAALVALVYGLHDSERRRLRSMMVQLRRPPVAAVLVLAGLVIAAIAVPRIVNLLALAWQEYVINAPTKDRYELYGGALRLLTDSPLFGRGPGTYGSYPSVLFGSPVYDELGIRMRDSLKMGAPYASLLGEYGILGALAFGAFIVLLGRSLFKLSRQAAGTVVAALAGAGLFMLVNMAIESIVHQTFRASFVAFFAFVGIGVAHGLAMRGPSSSVPWDPTLLRHRSRVAAVVIGVVLIAAIWVGTGLGPFQRMTADRLFQAYPTLLGVIDTRAEGLDALLQNSSSADQVVGELVTRWDARAGTFQLWDSAPGYANEAALNRWDDGRKIMPVGGDFGDWSVPADPTWTEDPYGNESWRQWYQSLAWLKAPAYGALTTSRTEYAVQVKDYVLDWITDHPLPGSPPEAWAAPVVASRLGTLLFLHDSLLPGHLSLAEEAQFVASLHQHGLILNLLISEAPAVGANDRLRQAVSLYQLAARFPELTGAGAFRSQLTTGMGVGADGVSQEGTSAGQLGALSRVASFAPFLGQFEAPRDLLTKMADYSALLSWSDASGLSDDERATMRATLEQLTATGLAGPLTDYVLTGSGLRPPDVVEYRASGQMFMQPAAVPDVYTYADLGDIRSRDFGVAHWSDGIEILSATDDRRSLTTVFVDGESAADGSARLGTLLDDENVTVAGGHRSWSNGVSHTRALLIVKETGTLYILDTLKGTSGGSHDFELRLLLSGDANVMFADGSKREQIVTATYPGEHEAYLRTLGSVSMERAISGETSQAPFVSYRIHGESAWFVTAVKLDAEPSWTSKIPGCAWTVTC